MRDKRKVVENRSNGLNVEHKRRKRLKPLDLNRALQKLIALREDLRRRCQEADIPCRE